jgi:hypothetical protein
MAPVGRVNQVSPKQRPPLVISVLLVIVSVVAVASMIWNVAAFSMYAADESRKAQVATMDRERAEAVSEREQAVKDLASAVSISTQLRQEIETLKGRVEQEQGARQTLEGERDQLRKDLTRERRTPDQLVAASESDIVKRADRFAVEVQLGDQAKSLGLSEGALIEQVKSDGRKAGLVFADDSPHLLFLSVGAWHSPAAPVTPLVVRLSLIERWRVPGTESSWVVSVTDRVVLTDCETDRADAKLGGAISTLIGQLSALRR